MNGRQAFAAAVFWAIAATPIYATAIEMQEVASDRYRFAGLLPVFEATFRASSYNENTDPLGDFPKELEFVYKRKLKRELLIEAADRVLQETYGPSGLAGVEERIQTLNTAYEDVSRGDRYTLRYHPDSGTSLLKNGELVCQTPGEDFQRIYFSIWLGPNSPLDLSP